MRDQFRRAGHFGAGLVVGLGGIVGGSLLAAPAEAGHSHAGVACLATERGGILATEGASGSAAWTTARGARGQLLVPDRNAACQQINSVYVQTTSGGSFEFGWVMGWSSCTGDFYHEPTAFAWWSTTSGSSGCRVFANRTPAPGQDHGFRVSDLNANSYWGSYLNGTELQPDGVNLDFTQGVAAVGMERGDAADNGFTRFRQLDEYHDSNNWTDWDDLTANSDSDPDYRLRRDAGDAGATVQ